MLRVLGQSLHAYQPRDAYTSHMTTKMDDPSESMSERLADLLAEDKLIELWPEYPCLYNVRATEFRDRGQRQLALDEIAGKIQRTSDWVKNRLRQLRNVFTRHNKPASSGSARKNVTKRTAWLLEKLQFLLPYIASRATQTNLHPCSPGSSEGVPANEESFPSDSQDTDAFVEDEKGENDDIVLENFTVSKPTKKPSRKRLKKVMEDEELKLIQSLSNSINRSKERANDELALFGQFVAESLRKLDSKTQYTAQNLISKVLFDAKMGLLNSNLQPLQQSQYTTIQPQQYPTCTLQPSHLLSSYQLPFTSGQNSQLLSSTIQSPTLPLVQSPPLSTACQPSSSKQPLPQQCSNITPFSFNDSQQMLSRGGQRMIISNCQGESGLMGEELNLALPLITTNASNEEQTTHCQLK